MTVVIRFWSLWILAVALLVGCGKESAVRTVSFVQLDSARRESLANEIARAAKGFDEFYSPDAVFTSEVGSDGKPNVLAKCNGKLNPATFEKNLGIVVANFAQKCPGIGFMAIDERTWRFLLPDDMRVPDTAKFDLTIP